MKKLVLIITGLLMGLTTVTAEETLSKSDLDINVTLTKRYHHAQPILFVERGIEFIIFPNGDFDFNTALDGYGYNDQYSNDLYYRTTNTRRGPVVSAPGTTSRSYNLRTRGVQIIHDRYGNVRRIGNVFINYDFYGRVNRIGSVFIKYNRNRLVQVGGLKLIYNKHGKLVNTRGQVNRQWRNNWTYNHFNFDNNNWDNNDDFYYYKKDGKKVKRSKALKKRN